MSARDDLISTLRTRLSDDRSSVSAFSLTVTANASSAILETTNGFLSVTVEGGQGVSSIRWNLSLPQYSTVGRLVDQLSRLKGYACTPDPGINSEHPSSDLRVDGLPDIKISPVSLRHHMFSNDDLAEYLSEAVSTHNSNYNLTNVPKAESAYVIKKAQAAAYRELAADGAKHRGLGADANTYISLSRDLEAQYREDYDRHKRTIPAPKIDETKIGTGDAIQGTLIRRSLRAGYSAPYRSAVPPTPPRLFDPSEDDVEDVTIRLRWSQARENGFSSFELWRDTQPVVERSITGRLQASLSPTLATSTPYSRAGTSKQVLGVSSGGYSSAPTFDGAFFYTYGELNGASMTNSTFIDGLSDSGVVGGVATLNDVLEPETDYYYRLYAINTNGEIVPSEVRKYRTRAMRGLFKRAGGILSVDALSAYSGVYTGAVSVTLLGTTLAGCKVVINGKECTIVSNSGTEIVFTTPAFTNAALIGKVVDVVLVSPNGLRDILLAGWRFT